MTDLSNSLADLAERIRSAAMESVVAAHISIERALEAGQMLCLAKDECSHGNWQPFLTRAGVHERQARRLMQVARSGLNSGHMSDLGGIAAILAYLADRQLPGDGECLLIIRMGWTESKEKLPLAVVSPSTEHPEQFDVGVIDLSSPDAVVQCLAKPIKAEPIRMPDGSFRNPLWEAVDAMLSLPIQKREFLIAPKDVEIVPREIAA